VRLKTILTALCLGLAGCAAPGPDDVLKRVAEGGGEDGRVAVAAGTPRDAVAMQAAKNRADQDLVRAAAKPPVDPPSVPGAEQITVVAPRSFAGTWRMVSPTTLTAHADAGPTYENVQAFICRFEQHASELSGACLPSRKKIDGQVDGDRVTLDWSRGLASAGMDGTLLSPNEFRGRLSVGALGIRVSTDIPVYGSKLDRSSGAGVPDPIAGEVLQALTGGEVAARRFTAAALTRFRDDPPLDERERRALGAPVDQVFLDRIEVPADDDGPNRMMAVYQLSFEQGWRLCGIALNAAGQVESVDCS